MVRATLFGGPLDGEMVELDSLDDVINDEDLIGDYVVAHFADGVPVKHRNGTYCFMWQGH